MKILELMKARHSVRVYENKQIENEKRLILQELVSKINQQSGLHIQICYDDPTVFDCFLAHYGKFSGVQNYIALVGKKNKEEAIGYFGEQIVLKAQEIGLNTCWVALTYKKKNVRIQKEKNEKLYCVIALGYGKIRGLAHHSRKTEEILHVEGEKAPNLDVITTACLLAPTAMNQQKFLIQCIDQTITIQKKGIGFYTTMDLGIVKCHYDFICKELSETQKSK